MNRGIFLALGAMLMWGVFPMYFKLLQHVPAFEILSHRIIWCLPVVVLMLVARRTSWQWLRDTVRTPKLLLTFVATALLVAANWGIYIWAVNRGHVIEASLGYFINPLLNAVLGAIFLHERLSRGQYAGIAVVACGVAWIIWCVGHLPVESLLLPLTFGFYGLLRKKAPLPALEGLTLETMILAPLAVAAIFWMHGEGWGATFHADTMTWMLFLVAGPVTAVPLLLFNAGARLISYTTMGIIQYSSPTVQFLIGLLVFSEPFNADKGLGFAIIWSGIAVFTWSSMALARRRAAAANRQAA